jgi:hypothetical protein
MLIAGLQTSEAKFLGEDTNQEQGCNTRLDICEKNIKLEDWFYVNKLINRVYFLKNDDFLLDKRI